MHKKVIILFCLAGTLISSCKFIKIEISDKRNPTSQIIFLISHIEVSPTGITKISKSDFFPSSIRIKDDHRLIYIDPLAISDTNKADFIFITHAHLDHFSVKDISKISKPETLIICPKCVAKRLGDYNFKIREVKPGDSFYLDNNLKVEAVYAYNLKSALLWLKAHPKSKQNVGYVLEIDSIRIYHTGDTDYIPEIENIRDINLILVPIGGDNLTMNVEDAARLVNQLKPEICFPMHYDIKDRSNVYRFMNLIDKNIWVRVFE